MRSLYLHNYVRIDDIIKALTEIRDSTGENCFAEHDHFADEISFYTLENTLVSMRKEFLI